MKRLTQKLGVTEIELVQLPGKAATVAASEYVLDYTAKQNGSHIARIRRKMSMTQAELARRSGLTEDIIEGIEKGQDLPLTVATHLAAALDCGIPALIGEFEGPRRPNRNTQPGRRTQDAFAGLKDLFLVLAELSALNEPEVAANFVNSAIKDLRAMLAGYRGEPLPEEISTPKQRTSKG